MEKIWNADIYVRLSKEDGDMEESDSISNQRALIRDYLSSKTDINIITERVDDGFTGTNFQRPSFIQMMEDIKSGAVNCVVVKDLSRFGRNFSESGKYLQQIFPFFGVRFISINDNIDSLNTTNYSDGLVVSFKNLLNDAYARDISIKTRSQLEIKRKMGDFISPFAVYGYLKDEQNHNKLVVDELAAPVVRDIFKWKIEGMSHQGIADRLNQSGILSPLEHKRMIGLDFFTSFKSNAKAKWTAKAVGRILSDEVYTGVLAQGKTTTPNHKLKNSICRDKSDWVRVENTHEPIIGREQFELANSLLKSDMRIAPNADRLYTFSGILKCGDCGMNMVRKTVPSGNKKHYYYICKNSRKGLCTGHSIREGKLEQAVLAALQAQIERVLDIEKALMFIDTLPVKHEEVKKINKLLLSKQDEIKKYRDLKVKLFETFDSGLIDESDFTGLNDHYTQCLADAEKAAAAISGDIESIVNNGGEKSYWIEQFKEYRNFAELDRKIAVSLIKEILVYEGGEIDLKFKHENKCRSAVSFAQSVYETAPFDECPVLEVV
jgi:DNA invertase Pin-like site-specific DNA recombinase